jgi:flagellar protein FliS
VIRPAEPVNRPPRSTEVGGTADRPLTDSHKDTERRPIKPAPGLSDTISAMTEAAENPYLRDAVLTATQEQLHLMLYDGAIRFARQARDALQAKDFARSYDRLTRAQNIISEMQSALNYDVNPELCQRVASIYGFLYRKLVDANVHRDIQAVDDALRILVVERETWQILVDKVHEARSALTGSPDATPPVRTASASITAEGQAEHSICVDG